MDLKAHCGFGGIRRIWTDEQARAHGARLVTRRGYSGLWMQHCYQCDWAQRRRLRREVQTGSSRWSSWSFSGRGRVGSGTRMGLRTVCEPCAGSIDRANRFFLIVEFAFSGRLIIFFLRLCHPSEGGDQTAASNALTTPRSERQATETPAARAPNGVRAKLQLPLSRRQPTARPDRLLQRRPGPPRPAYLDGVHGCMAERREADALHSGTRRMPWCSLSPNSASYRSPARLVEGRARARSPALKYSMSESDALWLAACRVTRSKRQSWSPNKHWRSNGR